LRKESFIMAGTHVSLRLIGVLLVGIALGGCQPSANQSGIMIGDTPEVTGGADLQRTTEVQLVEQMARHRTQYRVHLELLRDFYDRQGSHLKSTWADEELENLVLGPNHSYLVIAEISGSELRATTAIVEADLLYEEGMKYFKQAQGFLPPLVASKKKLNLAKDKFNELITNYPTSDKIDDAAFQIAEIYNRYLKDYHKALLYYQRVWQWDYQTSKPARYAVARIYDDYLHNRIKALEYYQQAVNLESRYPDKVAYAKRRVEEISQGLSNE